ncbi:hypothetical protein [Paracoccus jeotgali]|uniref:hypothetical protein n=1 Tax=Paracoccus jeotgali TaxID=2065379 RepID=UPI0028ADED8D|nr:hypothetical protein [Paracoccus jeotgali]
MMRAELALSALLAMALIAPGGAVAQEATQKSARLIHLDQPPNEAGLTFPITPRPGMPPQRPVIVVLNNCAWPAGSPTPDKIRESISGPVWLLAPQEGECESAQIASIAARAAASPEGARLALLLAEGLRLIAPPPRPQVTVTARSTAAPLPGTVIAALPPSLAATDGTAPVITARTAPADALATARLPAPPRKPGQPEPALVVGEMATLIAPRQPADTGIPRADRERVRKIDPGLFQLLLQRGRFDPPQDRLAAAIQTELQLAGCYGGAVHGQWGAGTLAALRRYLALPNAPQAEPVPDVTLFRRLADAEGLRCPAPIAAPVRSTPARATAPAATRARTAPARAAPPAPPAATSGPRIDPSLLGGLGSGASR